MESDYYELGVYIFFLGLIVQSLFRIFDPIIDAIRNGIYNLLGIKSPPEYEELDVIRSSNNIMNESIDETIYFKGDETPQEEGENSVGHPHYPHYRKDEFPYNYTYTPRADREDRVTRRKMKVTWKDLIGPPLIGLGVAWLFLPNTVFNYIGFQPRYPIIAYIVTALLISRIANAEYDTFKTVGQFFVGIANKFKF